MLILRPRPASGAIFGLGLGAVFFGLVLAQDIATGDALREHTLTVRSAAAIYLGGGTIGGALIGLLLPQARWRIGAGVLGGIGLLPVFGGISVAIDGLPPSMRAAHVVPVFLAAFGVGGTIGVMDWRWLVDFFDTRPQPQRRDQADRGAPDRTAITFRRLPQPEPLCRCSPS